MAAKLQARKLGHIADTGAEIVATGNPGCHLQLVNGAARIERTLAVVHPISLLAQAYRMEGEDPVKKRL